MNKPHLTLKSLLLAVTTALGCAATAARAGGLDEPLTATTPVGQGLLGQQYAGLTYSYIDLDAPVHADNFEFSLNQPLNTGLDALFAYNWTQTGVFAGDRLNQQSVSAGLRAFSNRFAWGKPYAEAGVGYIWQRGHGGSDNSFAWAVGAGAELQLAPAFTVTPSVSYVDAPDLAGHGTWTFAVKANYWVDSQWSVTAGFARDDDHNNVFTVGTNFRF